MADPIRIHTSTRIAVSDPTDIEWVADADHADRHAFARRDGYPARALCGVRWTTRMGQHGSGACVDCLAALKEQVRAASVALRAAEHDELAAGEFYAGMPK